MAGQEGKLSAAAAASPTPPSLPDPPGCGASMCAAQAAPPGPPPPPGAGARVADTAPQPGGHLHKGRAAGPARGPRGPALRQRRCRPMRLASARYPLVRGERKKGRNEGRGAGGGAVAATSAASSSSSPRRAPSPTQPSPRSRYVPVPVASPSRRGDNGRARPGPARPRAPAHPPRSLTRRAGGGTGWGGGGVLARSAAGLRGNFQIRGTRPRALTAAAFGLRFPACRAAAASAPAPAASVSRGARREL